MENDSISILPAIISVVHFREKNRRKGNSEYVRYFIASILRARICQKMIASQESLKNIERAADYSNETESRAEIEVHLY